MQCMPYMPTLGWLEGSIYGSPMECLGNVSCSVLLTGGIMSKSAGRIVEEDVDHFASQEFPGCNRSKKPGASKKGADLFRLPVYHASREP